MFRGPLFHGQFLSLALSGLFAVALALAPSRAIAVPDQSGFIGGMGGIFVPSSSGTSARPGFGLIAGAKLGSELGLAGYYMTNSQDETQSGVKSRFGYDLYGVQASYHFEGEAQGAYFGLRLGLSKVSQAVLSQGVSSSPYHVGVVAGYDHMIWDLFSLGGEISYISIGQADVTVSGQNLKTDSFNSLNLLGSVKFWF